MFNDSELTLKEIIHGWEYFATIGIVGYGVLWIVGKIL